MMNRTERSASVAALLWLAAALAGCGNERAGDDVEARQTQFPGQITAGGGTSGEVLNRTVEGPKTPEPEGTPGIPQGAEGNVGGAALGGTVPEDTSLGGSGQKTPEQAREATLPTVPAASAPQGAASR